LRLLDYPRISPDYKTTPGLFDKTPVPMGFFAAFSVILSRLDCRILYRKKSPAKAEIFRCISFADVYNLRAIPTGRTWSKTIMAKKNKDTGRKTQLKAADLKKFEQLLLHKRAEILGDVDHMKQEALKKERSDLSNVPFHMADAGSDNFEMENTLGLMDEEVKILTEIDAALTRIERKTYGICEGSGKPIPKARLEAIPWARYCVEYKQLLEKGLVEAPGSAEPHPEDYDEQGSEDEESAEKEESSEEDEADEVMEQLDKHISMMGDDEGDTEEETEKS